MSTNMKAHVIERLENFQSRAKQIDLLHYKLSHPTQVSANEMIEAMSLAHGEGQGSHNKFPNQCLESLPFFVLSLACQKRRCPLDRRRAPLIMKGV